MKNLRLALLVLLAPLVAFGAEAEKVLVTSSTELKPEDRSLRWVNALGQVKPFDWPYTLTVFPDDTANIAIAIAPPATALIETLSPGQWDPKRRTGISLFNRKTHSINFETNDKAAVESSSSLVLQLTPRQPLRFVDSACADFGFRFLGPALKASEESSYLYLHFDCMREKSGLLAITISIPKEEVQIVSGSKDFKATPSSLRVTFDPTKAPPKEVVAVASFKLLGKEDPNLSEEYEISYEEPTARWSFNTALSLTFMSYSQPEADLSIDQFGISGKIAARYTLKPNKFLVDGNIWGTLVPIPLSRTPSDLPNTRFFGFNLRGVYLLPETFRPLEGRWNVALGWYIWSMLNGRSYGVSRLSGPQFFVGTRADLPSGRSWQGYLKYSPISPSLSQFSFNNFEIAIGGGYTFVKWEEPITATLDLARVQASTGTQSLSLTTVNVGLQIPIPFRPKANKEVN